MTKSLDRYESFDFLHGPWIRKVFWRGTGPAVIIIHEIPGLNPLVVRFADRVADAGMTVYLPSLFGQPGRPASYPYVLGSIASVTDTFDHRPVLVHGVQPDFVINAVKPDQTFIDEVGFRCTNVCLREGSNTRQLPRRQQPGGLGRD
jgi:dienelactone hydrolase